MPIVSIPEAALHAKLGHTYTDSEFEELCFQYGLELDEITTEKELVSREQGQDRAKECSSEKIYKVEVPANRSDLLCSEGLCRALMIFSGRMEVPTFSRSPVGNMIQIFVKPATREVRPYAIGAVLRNISLDEARFKSLIDLQEKLHQTIGRKRKLVAIGTHDLDKLEPPFVYNALTPKSICFVPLNKTQRYTGEELMKVYATDPHLKAYLPLVQDKPVYPVFSDARNTVLSMPPIINGEHSRISVNTRNIFLDITGTDLHKASIVLDTLVTMFSEYCDPPYTVEPVEVIHHDGSRTVYPRLDYRNEVVSIDYTNRLLGTQFTEQQVASLLHRMGLTTSPVANLIPENSDGELTVKTSSVQPTTCGLLSVLIPPTRHDILHACDIVEDVAIAYGYDNIPEQLPQTCCIAQSQPINRLTDMLRAEIAQMGFTEVLSFSLCSREDISTKLRQDLRSLPAVHISNPKSAEFQVVRTTLLPGILNTLSSNRMLPLPLKVFEVQDVVLKDCSKDVGARNNRRVCAAYYNKSSGFEVMHGLLDRLMQLLCIRWKEAQTDLTSNSGDQSAVSYELRASEDPAFFAGRCADVVLAPGNNIVGRLGVVHPEVLHNFDLVMPCSVLDLDLQVFL
ncbi:unnamed protein product [Calicophoron daubneyi]|uniref:Phenylalanine--tRNA ligase beta subunit n=1 Tax=Calicophoron daubneyi TaxID=300641 RepID=A0AAV2T598_CALDB